MPGNEELHNGFEIGEWQVLPARAELHSAGQVINPEPKVFKALRAVAARDGDVVTKDEFIDEVWDGRATGEDPIIRCVYQLSGHFCVKQ
jgi:DNA-binding winged helix-turn-helix (wHTH) protein